MACLPAACYLFNKFWFKKQKVTILGYDAPNFILPENFHFVSLGKQRGPAYWSNDMFDFYSNCNEKYIYSIWEDCFILKPVDKKIIEMFEKVISIDNNFFKFNLTADVARREHKVLKSGKELDLILASQTSAYRFSTQHCIWNRELFLQKLKLSQSPWDFELNNKDAMNNGLNVYATKRKYAIYMGHLYKSGKKRKNWHACCYGPKGDSPKMHEISGLDKTLLNLIENSNWVPEI